MNRALQTASGGEHGGAGQGSKPLRVFNPEMLVLAREARGMTQTELAARMGISQSKVSKLEDGLSDLSDESADGLVSVLGFPVRFYFQPGRRHAASPTFYRKHATLEASILRPTVAKMDIVKRNLAKLLSAVEPLACGVPFFDPQEVQGGPAEIARRVRGMLRIPEGPVRNLTEVVEEAGVIVIPFDFGTRKIAGCGDFVENVPVVFINRQMEAPRWRFTLAHELAHLVMHRIPSERAVEENEANTFAGEFLMPELDIKSSLLPISIARLARLKLHWRVSMQALLKRAGTLRLITPRTERYHFMTMGKLGIREVEPHDSDIPKEHPRLFEELLQTHLSEFRKTSSELAEWLAIGEGDFAQWYQAKPQMRVIRGGREFGVD